MVDEGRPEAEGFTATPEELHEAYARLAESGRFDYLVEGLLEEVVRPFAEAGVDLGDDRVLTAVLVACRMIIREVEALTVGLGKDLTSRLLGPKEGGTKDLAAALCRSVAAQLVGEACENLTLNATRASRMARLRAAT